MAPLRLPVLRLGRAGSRLALLPTHIQAALVVGALVALTVVGYVVLLSPKRSAAADVEAEIQATQREIDERRARSGDPAARLEIADVFELTRAMPDGADTPEVILELTRLAEVSNVSIESISVEPPVKRDRYQVLPIGLAVEGRYFGVTQFLARMRRLVRADGARVTATGRLFAVDSISFAAHGERLPRLRTLLTVSALMYGATPASGGTP